MPEFILDRGDPADSWYDSLDAFTQGFVEAAFFTDTGSDNEEEGLGEGSCVSEIALESRAWIVQHCAAWQSLPDVAALLDQAYSLPGYDATMAGRDFWFTSNGHGVGFWDRRELQAGGLGDKLSALCGWRAKNRFGEVGMYRGDDGLIYFCHG